MATLRRIHQLTHVGTDKFGAGVKGVPVLLYSPVADGASVNIFTTNSPAITVADCWGVMTGAGDVGDTFTVDNGTTAIVTVDVSAAGDKDIMRALEIDDATRTLVAGSSLRVLRASGALVDVYVLAYFD